MRIARCSMRAGFLALTSLAALCMLSFSTGGCAHTSPKEGNRSAGKAIDPPVAPALKPILELYKRGDYTRALTGCVDLQQQAPDTPGLVELRQKVLQALTEQRALRIAKEEELTAQRMAAETSEHLLLPSTYGLTRYVDGENISSNDLDSPILAQLEKPVSVHLRGADVAALIDALSKGNGINMIADAGLAPKAVINIEVDNVPLRELLDYVSRNCGVQFYLGKNMIWVTSPDPNRAAPLIVKIFRLRKGLQLHGGDWGAPKTANKNDITAVSEKATVLPVQRSFLEDAIDKFVTPVPGSLTLLDRNTHTLLARNTPDNLRLISELVSSLDRDPPQVLLEARFLEIGTGDMREIGLDWILDSPIITSQKPVTKDGVTTDQPRTIINKGNVVQLTPAAGAAEVLGMKLPDASLTANSGLNVTFQGLLTEPMFQAVLHALDISGRGKILSAPRLTTVNNNPAKLRDGEDLMYYTEFTSQAFSVYDAYGRPYQITALVPKGQPETAELGITLVAVPSIGADRRTISLLLTPTISELTRFESYQDVDTTNAVGNIRQVVVKLPVIARREVQTKVIVQSGETVVLGGLIRKVKQNAVHKVPFLGSIPLLGALFRWQESTDEQRNLLIFVTATVLSERGENLITRETATAPATTAPSEATAPMQPHAPAPAPAPATPPGPPPAK